MRFHLWIGMARNPAPATPCHFAVGTFNVGGWLTHGDLALDARVDFLAAVEHRLITARVRSEWARLRARDWPLSGHLLARIPPMWVMLVLA